jgi:hypothetical protein
MSLSEDDLLDIEDIIKDCSPGPWYDSTSYDGTQLIICKKFLSDIIAKYEDPKFCSQEQLSNFSLMAQSREIIPKLIKEIRELKEEVRSLEQQFLEMS